MITHCYTILDMLLGLLSTTAFTHVMKRLLTEQQGSDVASSDASFESLQITRKALEVLGDRLMVLRKTEKPTETKNAGDAMDIDSDSDSEEAETEADRRDRKQRESRGSENVVVLLELLQPLHGKVICHHRKYHAIALMYSSKLIDFAQTAVVDGALAAHDSKAEASGQTLKAKATNAQLALLSLDLLCYVCMGGADRDQCSASLSRLLPTVVRCLHATNTHVPTSALLCLGNLALLLHACW